MSIPARGFSIIIPSHNEGENIGRCLHAIRSAQDRANIQTLDIHVVDDCSTDDTLSAAAGFGVSVHVMTHRVSIATLRNVGVRMSTGDVLLFLDADMEVPADWLQAIQNYFRDDRVDVLGFVDRVPHQAPWVAKVWSRRVLARRPMVAEVDYLPSRNIACRREFFERIGGFDETLTTSEDKDLVLRLKREGARVISDPNLRMVHWGYERSLLELVRKEFWRQGNNLNLIQRHGGRWRLLRFPAMSLAHIGWGVLVTAAILSGHLMWGLLGTLTWFAPSLLTAFAQSLRPRRWLHGLQLTFLSWLRYNVAGVALICEFVRQIKARKFVQRVA